MKNHCLLVTATTFAVALATSRPAHADPLADLEQVAQSYMSELPQMARRPSFDSLQKLPPDACYAAVTTAKAAGAKATDTMASYNFWQHPKVVKNAAGEYTITVDDVTWICSEYESKWFAAMANAYAYRASDGVESIAKYDAANGYPADAGRYINTAKECIALVDRALSKGVAGTTELSTKSGKTTLGALKATYCEPLAAAGADLLAKINSIAKAKADAILAVYKKVGIKGKRLELFAYYGLPDEGAFLAAGCSKHVTTAKGLKKAKKLFIWLTNNDGTVTVRKYTFKGDTYKTTERSFLTEGRAYKGCK